MGEYEDLLARAKDGDESAFEELETKYSGTALRQQAEEAAALKKQMAEQAPLVRKAKFQEYMGQLEDDLKSADLTLDDLGEVTPGELTLDMVTQAAERKIEARNASILSAAKSAGFDTVEEFQAAMNRVKQERETNTRRMETVGSATASGTGGPVPEQELTRSEAGQRDFKEAKRQGATDDVALGEAVHTILAHQAPVEG